MSEPAKPALKRPPGYRPPGSQGYTPAPRKPALPPSLRPRKRGRSRCCCCCCLTVLLLTVLILLIALLACLFFLWYDPRPPVFHLQKLKFSRFDVSTGPDGPALNSQAVVMVQVRNPNAYLNIIYDKTEVSLKTEIADLGAGSLPAFTQKRKNTTALKFTVVEKNELIGNSVSKKLKDGVRRKSLVMETEVRTGIGMAANGWSSMTVPVKALCGGLSLKQVEGGAVPKCSIYIFKWLKIN
ncbi:NDR1/HIN1-like protein 13 [Diospyros lotus]|uniref:NDR1/HIN1-like protein 13 n=1 Tax=Diospyros lotus TaxID=55363 RepID=UPI00224E4C47|nr:NDR1/HIN1-like protein 13 [Diospyros lotus]